MCGFILSHRLTSAARQRFLIKSYVGWRWLLWQQLICRVGHSSRHCKWAKSRAPKPPHKSKKEAGSCSSAVITKPWWSQSSFCWKFAYFFHIHNILYASDTIWFIADYWAVLWSVHISSYCLISCLCGRRLPLSPFPRQHLHLLLYPFRKMFALFYWSLRGI